MVIVPLLALGFGVDLRYAIGASLVSVIATSSGAAAAYVREGYSNLRIGMFLEIATSIGAIAGAILALGLSTAVLSVVFGVALIVSALLSSRPRPVKRQADKLGSARPPPAAGRLLPTPEGPRAYHVDRTPLGFGLMFLAGVLSGMLGIGSGAFKVLAMDQAMQTPLQGFHHHQQLHDRSDRRRQRRRLSQSRLHRSRSWPCRSC